MSTAKISRVLLVAGLLLFIMGIAWPYILPGTAVYSDKQATELSQASEALHETMHAHGHGHDHDHFGGDVKEDDNPEIKAAATRYRAAQGELESAKFWTSSLPVYMRWTGLAVCLAGIATFLPARRC